jgi:16S rRNA (guanine966-N2)-methyltransferase
MRIIAGEWRGRRIRAPAGSLVRPTSDRVREAWMSSMAPRIPRARVVDLFAGSGALGLEALSRGAGEVVFVEQDRGVLEILRANVASLGAEDRCMIVRDDAFRFLRTSKLPPFDLALADPPYGQGYASRLLEVGTETGFASEIWVEHGSREPMPPVAALRQRRYGDTTLSVLETLR